MSLTGLPLILYENRFMDATPVASSTAAGDYDVLNLRDFRPYTWHKFDTLPGTITVDCGSARAADYLIVWGHDLGTQGATVELRGSTDNFATSDVLVASSTPADDKPFVLLFASVSYRYWRIRVTGTTVPVLAIVAAGQKLEMPMRLPREYDQLGRVPQGNLVRSTKGHPLARTVDYEDFRRELFFRRVTWSWLRATWQPAWEAHLRDTPHVWAWDPTNHADELNLVSIEGGYQAPGNGGSYCSLSYSVAGVAA